ncbi:hypothetical protein PLESTB_000674300 [Pleodorina starrii]|uniref:Uncharacterized protein n=1 Tax=Pleodorina starrii TaxID=330485 RepID=A0A9W6BJE0_9CHLO|nr:hypothetical protein PLESTB_000674300 [Pleodorina starrii]
MLGACVPAAALHAEDEEFEGEDAEEDSSQPTSPNYGGAQQSLAQQQAASRGQPSQAQQQQQQAPLPQQPGSAELGQQLQQLQSSLLASSVLQQAALTGVLPLYNPSSLTNEVLASLGLSADALHGMEALSGMNLPPNNLADLTNLLRQHAQVRTDPQPAFIKSWSLARVRRSWFMAGPNWNGRWTYTLYLFPLSLEPPDRHGARGAGAGHGRGVCRLGPACVPDHAAAKRLARGGPSGPSAGSAISRD